ncbi:GntR family transcriptional regulator [Micromonospora sp. KC721]|uniref:GntR family transcriptional regulator n=1 Tax=Micromonospora sp. KC721 TaxID=2530380 RepID=UPI001FB59CB7|nr:GntR family transcriptional regulator [Micromonospora sp. KC721]
MIVNAVQQRIEDGTYPPGSMLPSETELVREFGASRPVVVRALDLLRQDGWIDSRQGKGRFVLGRPASPDQRQRERRYAVLEDDERAGSTLLAAGEMPAPPRAAAALNLEPGTPVVARRRVIAIDGVGPVELGTAYLPADLADGTGVGSADVLPEGLLRHVASRKRVRFDHVSERISARLPDAEEAQLLQIGEGDSVLTVLLSVCDRTGKPLLAVDLVLPASRHDLEDVYPLD